MEPKTDDPTCTSRRVGLAWQAAGGTKPSEIIKAFFPLRSDFVSGGGGIGSGQPGREATQSQSFPVLACLVGRGRAGGTVLQYIVLVRTKVQ